VEPIVIHLTYQRWWNGGKRSRMREFGLWHIEKPEYYSSASGGTSRFLTYENNVVPWVNAMASRRYSNGRQMPLFYKMWLGMSYQLAAFRCAGDRLQVILLLRMVLCLLLPCVLAKQGCYIGSTCSRQLACASLTGPLPDWPVSPPLCRDALAAATMLGRAVVLPKLWCWCDYHEGPDILRTCLKG
jgi:hypothetical protein